MSRIAVRQSNGDDVEKILPLLAPLASAASAVGGALASGAGMAARGIASLAGKTSIGRGIKAATGADGGIGSKLMAGAKAAGQQHMANKVGAKATGGEGGEGGEGGGQENLAGKFVAQQMQQQADKRQQANQQSMQNNQAMAEKAKANSQITTGEPMDMAWRLLKYDEEEYNLYYDDDGMPRDPRINPAFDENITDDSYGLQLDDEIDEIRDTPGFHDGVETEFTPEEIKEKERRKKVKESVAGFLQSQKLASEPMSLAWRMLKQMSDDDMQEWAYENLRNQGITIPDEREEEVIPKPEMPTLYY